jgi:hypothetical protein
MRREDIVIESPCGQDWSGMKPAGMKKRFCDTCKMHVHDLSKMTRCEAKALLSSDVTEGLCVRYLHDQHGDVVFTDSLVRAKRFVAGALAVAMPMTLTACMGAAPARPMKAPAPATEPAPAKAAPSLPVAK